MAAIGTDQLSSHGVRHPVDHVHHGESEREHGPGVDVDGVGINGLADTLGTALLVLRALLRLPGSSPPGLGLLAAALPGDFTAGALGPPVAVGNHHALVHSGDRQGKQNHGLFAVLHNGLYGGKEREACQHFLGLYRQFSVNQKQM